MTPCLTPCASWAQSCELRCSGVLEMYQVMGLFCDCCCTTFRFIVATFREMDAEYINGSIAPQVRLQSAPILSLAICVFFPFCAPHVLSNFTWVHSICGFRQSILLQSEGGKSRRPHHMLSRLNSHKGTIYCPSCCSSVFKVENILFMYMCNTLPFTQRALLLAQMASVTALWSGDSCQVSLHGAHLTWPGVVTKKLCIIKNSGRYLSSFALADCPLCVHHMPCFFRLVVRRY